MSRTIPRRYRVSQRLRRLAGMMILFVSSGLPLDECLDVLADSLAAANTAEG